MQTLHATYTLADIAIQSEKLLNQYTSRLLLNAFHQMGLFTQPNEKHTLQQMHQKVKLLDTHRQLFSALLDILERNDFITHRYNQFFSTRAASAKETLVEIRDFKQLGVNGLTDDPDLQDFIKDYLKLITVCVDALPEILSGEYHYTDVMFPQGDRSLVSNIYKSNIHQYLSQAVAETALQLAQKALTRNPGRKIQLIEIGAGAGITTGPILAALQPLAQHMTYWYTDMVPAFVRVGQRDFGNQYSFLKFRALDISRSPIEQGFTEGSFDLVICNNVLHATPVVTDALTHIHRLLQMNGQLILNEITKRLDYNTVTFGLARDWWTFRDAKYRTPFAPTLACPQWERLLTQTHFQDSLLMGLPGLASDEHPQSILTATRK